MSDYELKRIIALDETSTIGDSHVLAVDSENGTKKVTWETMKDDLKGEIIQGLSNEAKTALLNCFAHVVWTDDQGQTYYDALDDALSAAAIVSISAVYTQGGTVYTTDELDSLKSNLVVTAHYDNGTTEALSASVYTLSGTLTEGTSTITVTYENQTTTFSVTVASPIIIHLCGYYFVESSGILKIYGYNYRACSLYVSGEHAYPKNSDAESLQGDYYPIPIPQDASSVTLTMPSDLYVGIRVISWNGTGYITDYSSSWLDSNSSTLDVSAYNDGTHFVAFSYKSGSAGTTDMTNYDMSGVEISFS